MIADSETSTMRINECILLSKRGIYVNKNHVVITFSADFSEMSRPEEYCWPWTYRQNSEMNRVSSNERNPIRIFKNVMLYTSYFCYFLLILYL